jgi:hypothetical protein
MTMGASVTPATVARETLQALGHKTTVRPGLLSKFLIAALLTLPRALRVNIMAQIMGGMANQVQPTKPLAEQA